MSMWRKDFRMYDELGILDYAENFIEKRRHYIRKRFDPKWCSWFVGLIDGEGYFHLVRRRTRRSFEVELVINLRMDDKAVLEEIYHVLRIGSLYKINDELQRKQGIKASDRIRWRCCKADEIMKVLVPLFEEYPLHSKKFRDYQIWREAAFIKYRKIHLDEGYYRMMELVEELKGVRQDTPLNNRVFVRKQKKKILF